MSQNSLGPEVPFVGPALYPSRSKHIGRYITLEPIALDHVDGLWQTIGGLENATLWDYMFEKPLLERQAFEDFIVHLLRDEKAPSFTILGNHIGKALGYVQLLNVDAGNRVIEKGGFETRFHLRRRIPSALHYQGAKQGYSLVLYYRFRVADPQVGLSSLVKL